MPNKEELAYLAGLFDGEGCISITQLWTKENYQLAQARIAIKMCDRQGIDLAHRSVSVVDCALAETIKRKAS